MSCSWGVGEVVQPETALPQRPPTQTSSSTPCCTYQQAQVPGGLVVAEGANPTRSQLHCVCVVRVRARALSSFPHCPSQGSGTQAV